MHEYRKEINFLSTPSCDSLFEMMDVIVANPNADLTPYGIPVLITSLYTVMQYVLIGFGIFFFIRMFKRRRTLFSRGEITLDKPTCIDIILKNPGVIIFYAMCVTLMLINLIPTTIPQSIEPEVLPDGAEAIYKILSRFIQI